MHVLGEKQWPIIAQPTLFVCEESNIFQTLICVELVLVETKSRILDFFRFCNFVSLFFVWFHIWKEFRWVEPGMKNIVIPILVGEENETPFIRVWKPLPNR